MARSWQFIVSTMAYFWSYFNCMKLSCICKTKPFLGGMRKDFVSSHHIFRECLRAIAPRQLILHLHLLVARALAAPPQSSWALTDLSPQRTLGPAFLPPSLHVLCSALISLQFAVFLLPHCVLWNSCSVFLVKIALVAEIL